MESIVVLATENDIIKGDKEQRGERMANGAAVGSEPRKRLADISNLQQQKQDAKKPQFSSIDSKRCIEKLKQENVELVKLVLDRNNIIELRGIELQKLRINYQKLQQQNLQLAQANTQILAELNLGKDRLKALQHELGCKNGLLQARKLESKVKEKTMKCQIYGNGVETIKREEGAEYSKTEKLENKPCNTKRKRQSKVQPLDPTNDELIQSKEKVEKKRQSARFKSGQQDPNDLFKRTDVSGPSTVNPVQVDKERLRSRRQSARLKSPGQELTENLSMTSAMSPATVKGAQAEKKADDSRLNPTRQSARRKSQLEQESTRDLVLIDGAKVPVSPMHDDLAYESCPMTSVSSVKNESEAADCALGIKTQQPRRSSVRPMRRAAEKVQSYKEIPVNVKMRREN